jgi:hypothetical protein
MPNYQQIYRATKEELYSEVKATLGVHLVVRNCRTGMDDAWF